MKPSLNNRLADYVKISERDEMIAEYVDYIKFYGNFRNKAKTFFLRDNGETLNIACFRLTRSRNKQFIVDLFYRYGAYDMHIASFTENYVKSSPVLRCDLYGKGLLILNREDLWSQIELVFNFFGLNDVVLSRIDYAVDCLKMNWNKACSLKAKYTDVRKIDGVPYYVVFGNKESSPQFIRYYEKIKDLEESGYRWLYPDYAQYGKVMRYELQVNSDGIAKDWKSWKVENIKNLANFGAYIPKQNRSHHKYRFETEEYKQAEKLILGMRKKGDWHSLVKILNLAYKQVLLSGPIVEEEETKKIREKLELRAKKQDDKIYGEALEKLLCNSEIT